MPKLIPSSLETSEIDIGLPDKGDPVVYNEIDDLILPPFETTPTKVDLDTVDSLTGTSAADKITVHNGDDVVHALGGEDLIIDLANGNDQFFGDDGNDRFILGHGNDFVDGGDGSDTVDYSGSGFRVSAHLERGVIFVDGTDRVERVENIIGSDQDDILVGSRSVNVLHGMAGDDEITGGDASNDMLYGDGGNDTITGRGSMFGGDGDDTMTSISGRLSHHAARPKDTLYGDAGDDAMTGGTGADSLFGGLGNDIINGGDGDDLIHGGDGVNRLGGGSGADTFVFQKFGGDHIYDRITASFNPQHDKIDLRQIDADPTTDGTQSFVFADFFTGGRNYDDDVVSRIGGPALRNGITGLVSSRIDDGNTYIYIQTEDGFQVADIVMTGERALTEDNFIL